MHDETAVLDRLHAGQLPAVVLGDLSLVRPLARASIPILFVTPEANDVALRSRHVRGHLVVPPFEEIAHSARALIDLGKRLVQRLGARVPLFYNSDKNLELIYRYRRELSEQYLLLLNDNDVAWALHDKERFHPLTDRAGVLAPRTLQSTADIDAGLAELREPLLVKPKRKNVWKHIQKDLFDGTGKARVFATRMDLLAHPAFAVHKDDVIVQEFIGADVKSLSSFHGFADEDSRLLASYCGRKIRTLPDFAGESCFIELTHDVEVDSVGRSVVSRLQLKGPFKIDFIRDPQSGRLYTLEINARFNLWNQLGAVHGVNLPAIAYDYLVSGRRPVIEPVYRPRYRWLNFYSDYHAFREKNSRGELSGAAWLRSLADPRLVCQTFAWDDPAPFAHWVGSFVRNKAVRPSRQRA